LIHVIMQILGDPPALLFLCRQNPTGQRMQLFFASLQGQTAGGQVRRARVHSLLKPLVDFLQQ
jgi:hypothetical protein